MKGEKFTDYGVYAKADYEIAVSEMFHLLFYKKNNMFGTKLYKHGKLNAVCEYNSTHRVTSYAFINGENKNIYNNKELCLILGEDITAEDGTFIKDTIRIASADAYMPSVSEKGIAYCLKHWKLGNQLNVFEDALHFTMNTNKIEYVMMIRKSNNDIYCGASVTIPFDGGLFGGGQYFRIRNYADNAQPWCGFHCDLGNGIAMPEFEKVDCSNGTCVTTNQGIYWGVKRYTDDEIVLQGCGDDEYCYYRGVSMTERFMI